jgi:uncharacterized protein DUF1996
MRKFFLLFCAALFMFIALPPAHATVITEHCAESHRNNDDPIVFPGQPGASHRHVFFGNRTTNAFTTYGSLIASPATTCSDAVADASAYWVPEVYVNGVNTKQKAAPYWKDDGETVQAIPQGMAYVAGPNNGAVWGQDIGFACTSGGAIFSTPQDCTGKGKLKFRVNFPSCWNGLDPATASNFAYPRPGCPASHPTKIVHLLLQVDLPSVTNGVGLDITLASGHYQTQHADLFFAYDAVAFQRDVVDRLNG